MKSADLHTTMRVSRFGQTSGMNAVDLHTTIRVSPHKLEVMMFRGKFLQKYTSTGEVSYNVAA